jgi:tetratricopeptide (TPR) repeat protein
MKNLANTGARRLTTLVILVLPVCLLPACERQGGQAEPWDDTDGFVPAGVSRLPEGLQEKVHSLNEQLKEVPHNGEPLGRLGAIYFVNGFPEMAAKCFGRARELEPRSKHWCYYAGLAYEQLGRQADAAKAYERALQLDPDYASFYVKLADVLVASDRRRAVSLYEQALELNPKDTRAIYGLGLCAEAEGDPEAALARFREALQIIPNYKGAHAAMARVLTSLKRAPEAATHEAAARSGKTPVLDDLLFESLLRSGYSLEMLLHDALFLAEQRLFSQADREVGRSPFRGSGRYLSH